MEKEKIKINHISLDELLHLQAFDYVCHVRNVLMAVAKAHEEYLGYEIPLSKKVEQVIAQDVLELGIEIGRYDPMLKNYLEYHLYEYRVFI